MKKILALIYIFIVSITLSFASETNNDLKLSLNDNSPAAKTPMKRFYVGGDIGATFGDYTQISLSPYIGYRISNEVSTGLQFIYNHSWQYTNKDQENQTTLQSNTYGGNYFLQYNPVPSFYLKGEFEYDTYTNYTTTQGTNITQGVPFIFLGAGYSKAISRSATFNAGIKVDVLNNVNSPYEDFTPFLYAGVNVGI
ncbi:MAG: hypothetical protein IPL53_07965 [Ignavibacteria bacterium]|nr:hypothetical protein [Ignavibacteria bacterium]